MDPSTLFFVIQGMITVGKGDIDPTKLITKLFRFACGHLPNAQFVDALIIITSMVYRHCQRNDRMINYVHLPTVEFIVDHSDGKYSSNHLIKQMVKYQMSQPDNTLSRIDLVLNITILVLSRS